MSEFSPRAHQLTILSHLQVIVIILAGERHGSGLLHLLAVLLNEGFVDLGRGRSEGRGGHEFLDPVSVPTSTVLLFLPGTAETYQGRVAHKLASQPEEGLLEVVVGLGRDVVVLKVLLSVEGDGLGLDLPLLHVDLVAAEDDGNVLADSDEIACRVPTPLASTGLHTSGPGILTVPVRNILVRASGRDIKHDDAALPVDVVSITEPTELLLTSRVPNVELDLAVVLRSC